MSKSQPLLFYITPEHRCSYLPEKESVSLFADPYGHMDTTLYGRFIDRGFRRSGNHIYRPHCPDCKACVATRAPVLDFKPNRSQRRNWRGNQDITVIVRSSEYRDEHFQLYRCYINTRHAGGEMENPTPHSYRSFLSCSWIETLFIEFRVGDQLLGIAASDVLPQGLSAVYTFFDPNQSQRGLGTYAVSWQIAEVQRRGLDYVYLGYWIKANQKMSYKSRFRPIHGYIDGRWSDLSTIHP
ncbi:MAG: arginyltransferase [Gammaproteobacteria bacterium]|nr:arginyltransferase [Gammaproteobacteria bacterium]